MFGPAGQASSKTSWLAVSVAWASSGNVLIPAAFIVKLLPNIEQHVVNRIQEIIFRTFMSASISIFQIGFPSYLAGNRDFV